MSSNRNIFCKIFVISKKVYKFATVKKLNSMKATMKTLAAMLICCFISASQLYAENIQRPESENYIKGVEALNEGDPETAYTYLNAEINEHPDNGYAHCYMALICNFCHDTKLALQALNSSLELIPETDKEYRSFAHYSRGVLLTNLKMWNRAEEDLTEAIRLNPEDVENYKSRAQLYLETERYEESLNDLTRALKLDSKADVNDLVLQLMAVAPSNDLMERIYATYQQLDQVKIH